MNKVPDDATHYKNFTYFKKSKGYYAFYCSKGIWRESALVANIDLDIDNNFKLIKRT